ncbi:FAD/FMN-containing dehydrogenase [Actinomadura pelletieri DSM 43383]|uniref:FAD/FMN-containing dehydrogenase n=1 Tax=Actinomadura pelletieri DSM 43383 TaxID=1120940 RepID=A0A495R057_9ACTN|nr:FAD-binding protein [Actinomadura pelletieri]RKS79800.1 FAD/FMN-containing dehydrogenase [Actinomadura pelletieri DSM 43383]
MPRPIPAHEPGGTNDPDRRSLLVADHSRRTVLRGAALTAAAVPMGGSASSPRKDPPITVGPDDPRYRSLVLRGYNRRFEGRPDQIRVVTSTRDVVRAVDDAVRTRRRIAVRSGGHCFESFVDDPAVRMLVDMSTMTAVEYDERRGAFMVEAGATLGEIYRRLYLGWGVTIPGGTCADVGAGGHVAGGGYGALCRLHGLTVDHLYAVEVVLVGRSGRAKSVVATREPSDPHRDLWWAHTGGGGGNFGIVTRYWFRSPTRSLPRPPSTVLDFSLDWPWDDLSRDSFVRLLRNYGQWTEDNSAPGSPAAALYGEFTLTSRPSETITLSGQVATDTGARRLLDDLVNALGHGVDVRPWRRSSTLPWLTAATKGWGGGPGPFHRIKIKSGLRRHRFTDRQLGVAHHHLSRSDYRHPYGHMFINTYGGRVNTVAPDATAVSHRDSKFMVGFLVGWDDPAEDARHLNWIRDFYRDVYADTGGVPAGPADEGTFINYPDTDLADPRQNGSSTPWHTLYYGRSHPRLQQTKRRYDPHNVFHHPLSIR